MPELISDPDPVHVQSRVQTQPAQPAKCLRETIAQGDAAYWHSETVPAQMSLPTISLIMPSLYTQNTLTSSISKPI